VVGGQDGGFGVFVIAVRACILASVLLAGAALKAQFAVFGVTVADEMFAAAVSAAQGLGKHALFLPFQTRLSHYP